MQHILATASDQGSFSVWDVRKQKLTMDNVGADSGCVLWMLSRHCKCWPTIRRDSIHGHECCHSAS